MRVVPEISSWTDRQTHRNTQTYSSQQFATAPAGKVIIKYLCTTLQICCFGNALSEYDAQLCTNLLMTDIKITLVTGVHITGDVSLSYIFKALLIYAKCKFTTP